MRTAIIMLMVGVLGSGIVVLVLGVIIYVANSPDNRHDQAAEIVMNWATAHGNTVADLVADAVWEKAPAGLTRRSDIRAAIGEMTISVEETERDQGPIVYIVVLRVETTMDVDQWGTIDASVPITVSANTRKGTVGNEHVSLGRKTIVEVR